MTWSRAWGPLLFVGTAAITMPESQAVSFIDATEAMLTLIEKTRSGEWLMDHRTAFVRGPWGLERAGSELPPVPRCPLASVDPLRLRTQIRSIRPRVWCLVTG